MIQLTRLNGNPMVLNSDLIKTAEASPDTMLTLINGEKLIVREDCAEVTERVLAYRARLLAAVARRLPTYGDLQRVVALASLDVAGQPAGAQKRKNETVIPATRDCNKPFQMSGVKQSGAPGKWALLPGVVATGHCRLGGIPVFFRLIPGGAVHG